MALDTKSYRLDIQGLRAIAVLSVVLFHINPLLLPGGYVGVDIFFVISGYLIMGFIWRDLRHNSFNLLTFYTKRVYRLFPALFVMVAMTTVAAYFILLPTENSIYLKSMFSTLFYVSNFYFYTQANYFNDAMAFYPLLHTWSLSVEEQFYMLFPLLLIGIHARYKKYIFTLLFFIAILSLVLSQWYVEHDASFAFFASPTRFFQFIVGGVIAIYLQNHQAPKRFNDVAVTVGLFFLVISIYFYDKTTLFPGWNALLPSFGTALVLYYGLKTHYLKYLLENKVMNLLGNASYSIYLWHWPVLVFYKLKISPTLSIKEEVLLLGISLVLGILSWYYIENKTRRHTLSEVSLKPISVVVLTSMLFATTVWAIFTYIPYDTPRYKAKAYQYLDFNTSDFRDGKCFLTSKYNDVTFYDKKACVTYKEGKKNYLLLGDSHAAHYYSAMASMMKNNETLTQVTTSGCLPILPYKGAKRCVELNRWAYEELIPHKHFDTIILSANWRIVNKKYFIDSLNLLLKYTDKLIVLGPSMEYNQPLPRLLINLKPNEKSSDIYKKASHYHIFLKLDTLIKKYTSLTKAHYISTLDVLCQKNGCTTVTKDGTPVNFDNGHLTHEGAMYILNKIEDTLFTR